MPRRRLSLAALLAELTQVELAERAGMQQHHLSEMEHNKRPIGKASAKKTRQTPELRLPKAALTAPGPARRAPR